MEPHIRRRMSPAVLADVAHSYGVTASQLAAMDGFESFIYETRIGRTKAILRVGHSRRRPPGQVLAEMDWLSHLAKRDLGVVRPLRSPTGALVELVDDRQGDQFVAAAFRFAAGHPPTRDDWAPPLWQRYGRLIGSMHAATTAYTPPPNLEPRPHWDDTAMLDVFEFLPANETGARGALEQVLAHLAGLPRDHSDYGLIHQDAHAGNFFVDGDGAITLFDFDDCGYSWFVNDLAVVVFYALSWVDFDDDPAYVAEFWRHFTNGYVAEFALDPQWLEEIPWFLKLRELDTYAVIHRSMDIENIDDPWARRFMRGRSVRVNDGAPVIGFDFAAGG